MRLDHALKQVAQHWRPRSLLGAAPCLLVVEDGRHTGGIVIGGLDQRGDCGMRHAQIIETATRDEFVVQPKGGCPLSIIQHQVEIKNRGHVNLELVGH